MPQLPRGIEAHSTHFPHSTAPIWGISTLASKKPRRILTALPKTRVSVILQRNANELSSTQKTSADGQWVGQSILNEWKVLQTAEENDLRSFFCRVSKTEFLRCIKNLFVFFYSTFLFFSILKILKRMLISDFKS